MTETFRIILHYDSTYHILNQPERNFKYSIGDTYVASASFPDSSPKCIYLQGTDKCRDDRFVTLYTGHLKVLEELCRRQHWRFIICI